MSMTDMLSLKYLQNNQSMPSGQPKKTILCAGSSLETYQGQR